MGLYAWVAASADEPLRSKTARGIRSEITANETRQLVACIMHRPSRYVGALLGPGDDRSTGWKRFRRSSPGIPHPRPAINWFRGNYFSDAELPRSEAIEFFFIEHTTHDARNLSRFRERSRFEPTRNVASLFRICERSPLRFWVSPRLRLRRASLREQTSSSL